MKQFLFLLAFLISSTAQSVFAQVEGQPQNRFFHADGTPVVEFVDGTVILKLKPEFRTAISPTGQSNDPTIQLALQQLGATELAQTIPGAKVPRTKTDEFGRELVDLSLIYTLKFADNVPVAKAVRMLEASPAIAYAEPQYIYQAFYRPNDADSVNQYYLQLIRAYEAWDISQGDTSVVIGIIDTGTSFTHPDMNGKFYINNGDPVDGMDNDNDGYIDNYRGWDFGGDVFGFVGGDNNAQYVGTSASNDHGVLVGGVCTAKTDNALNMASVGFNTRQLPVRVAVSNGLAIVYGFQGLIYAADHGADIINLSWGGSQRSRFGEDAVNYAVRNRGKMVVAAAGNTPVQVDFYPASYPDVISVGGSEMLDAFWFQNSTFGSSFSHYIDLVAPARAVRTLKANSGVGSFSGTSLAAPIVCGGAALLKAAKPQYSMMQVAQRIRVSADSSIYTINNTNYAEKMGRGRLDCFKALVDSSPSVRILSLQYRDEDGDGYLRTGDTVSIWVKLINWLDPVENLKVKMTSATPTTITVLDGDWTVGHLGTLDTVAHRLCHFRIVVGNAVDDATLRFTYSGTGYHDKEFYEMNIAPSYFVTVDWNDVEFSASNTGEYGYTNAPTNNQGVGLSFRDVGGILSEGGFLVGTGPTTLADNMTRQGGAQNAHFLAQGTPTKQVPGVLGDMEANLRYISNGSGSPLPGLQVRSKIYEWRSEEDNGFAIMEYTFFNTTGSTLNNVHTGLYADWDAGYNIQNKVSYVPGDRLLYVNDPQDHFNPYLFGMSLLTPDSLHAYAKALTSFNFTMSEKWNAITSPPDSVYADFDDIFAFLGAGPFSIAPGDSHTVAFAQLGGVDSTELSMNAQNAYRKYWCVVKGQMTTLPDLGPDISHCGPNTSFFLNPGPGFASYAWNTGETTPTLTVDSIGTYTVTVTDGNGCVHHSTIHVEFHPGIEAGFTYSPSGMLLVGDTVVFTDTTTLSIESEWLINGAHICPDTNPIWHVFNAPGNQQVAVVVANQYCFDTAYISLQVDTLVANEPLEFGLAGVRVFPNPTQGAIHIEMDAPEMGTIQMALMDLHGRIMNVWQDEKQSAVWTKQIELQGLADGVYFLQIQTPKSTETRKIQLLR